MSGKEILYSGAFLAGLHVTDRAKLFFSVLRHPQLNGSVAWDTRSCIFLAKFLLFGDTCSPAGFAAPT
jgi:hypothetical protein